MILRITKAYIRHYSDSGQATAYVEWIDTSGNTGRTEGNPDGAHMKALRVRAAREGITVEHQRW